LAIPKVITGHRNRIGLVSEGLYSSKCIEVIHIFILASCKRLNRLFLNVVFKTFTTVDISCTSFLIHLSRQSLPGNVPRYTIQVAGSLASPSPIRRRTTPSIVSAVVRVPLPKVSLLIAPTSRVSFPSTSPSFNAWFSLCIFWRFTIV
jgi:hypothetical protein